MADSDTELCNLALVELGVAPMTDMLTDGTEVSNLCKAKYPQLRDRVLRAHPWNCATFRQVLALDEDEVDDGWEYSLKYRLPTDPYCLRVLYLVPEGEPYDVEGDRFLLTNAADASVKYIGRVTDVSKYDALLTDAFMYLLASQLAYPLTEKAQLGRDKWEQYKDALAEARSIDSQEGSPKDIDPTILIDVRGVGHFSDWWRNNNSI